MAHGTESRVLARRAQRELVHVGAAHEHRALCAQVRHRRRVGIGDAVIDRDPAVVTWPR